MTENSKDQGISFKRMRSILVLPLDQGILSHTDWWENPDQILALPHQMAKDSPKVKVDFLAN